MEIAAALALGHPVELIKPDHLVDPELLESIRRHNQPPEGVTVDEQGIATVENSDGETVATTDIVAYFNAGNAIAATAVRMKIPSTTVCNALRHHLR